MDEQKNGHRKSNIKFELLGGIWYAKGLKIKVRETFSCQSFLSLIHSQRSFCLILSGFNANSQSSANSMLLCPCGNTVWYIDIEWNEREQQFPPSMPSRTILMLYKEDIKMRYAVQLSTWFHEDYPFSLLSHLA